jgi:hypothetical protein
MYCNYSFTFFEEQASLFFCFTRLSWVRSHLTMLFYTANFTSPVLSLQFSLQSRLSQQNLEKMRLKMPAKCKVVGSWLCFHATIGFLRRPLWEHIFYVVLQEVTKQENIFHHIARKRAASRHQDRQTVDREKQWWRWACFLCHVVMSKQQGLQF